MHRVQRVSISEPDFRYDPQDPEGFRAGTFRIGADVGAEQTGTTVYELPPGQAVCPYHYEYGEEEWLLVLEGRPTMRTPDGSEQLAPFDVVFFPKGPAGAHQVTNGTDETVRVLMWSTVVYPTATAYPDSDKVGVWTGDKSQDVIIVRSDKVGYYHGESD
jgi:uncharacterized cupin superfamily protein